MSIAFPFTQPKLTSSMANDNKLSMVVNILAHVIVTDGLGGKVRRVKLSDKREQDQLEKECKNIRETKEETKLKKECDDGRREKEGKQERKDAMRLNNAHAACWCCVRLLFQGAGSGTQVLAPEHSTARAGWMKKLGPIYQHIPN